MTDSLKLSTVTASVAALTISVQKADGTVGAVKIDDVTGMPPVIEQSTCPRLSPRPDGFVTALRPTRDTYGADAALKTWEYVLHYVFYYAPVAQGNTLFEQYGQMVEAASEVLLALATQTNSIQGATDFLPDPIEGFGAQKDAKGTLFHGCQIAVRVSQYMET